MGRVYLSEPLVRHMHLHGTKIHAIERATIRCEAQQRRCRSSNVTSPYVVIDKLQPESESSLHTTPRGYRSFPKTIGLSSAIDQLEAQAAFSDRYL
jgi:hypothetical protein